MKTNQSSHLKAGLMAGALFGVAAGIFMSSKKGKQIAKDLQKHSKEVEARLLKELKKAKDVSEDTYGDAIDTVLNYYTKGKHIAKTEVPSLRRYLVGRWEDVQKELKPTAAKSKKR